MVVAIHQQQIKRPNTPAPAFILSDQRNVADIAFDSLKLEKVCDRNLDKNIDRLKEELGESHPGVAVAVNALGDASVRNEDYREALRYYNEALGMKKKGLSKNHPSIASTLRAKSDVLRELSMLQESLACNGEALKIYRNAFDDRSWATDSDQSEQQIDYNLHYMLANTLAGLGGLQYRKGNFDLAMKFFNEAHKEAKMAAVDAVVLDRNKGSSSRSLLKEARVYISLIENNIGNVFAEQKNKVRAIEKYNTALNLQMQELGEDHLSVACTLHNMGTMNYKTGELHLALKSYKQVLKMRRMLLGPEHPSVADALLTIAMVHEKAEEIDRASAALNAALKLFIRVYGENDVKVGIVRNCIGSLNARSEFDEEALEQYEKALMIYQDGGLLDDSPLVQSAKKGIDYVKYKDLQNNEDEGRDDEFVTPFFSCGGLCSSGYEAVGDDCSEVNSLVEKKPITFF